jgi:hypothetical protein
MTAKQVSACGHEEEFFAQQKTRLGLRVRHFISNNLLFASSAALVMQIMCVSLFLNPDRRPKRELPPIRRRFSLSALREISSAIYGVVPARPQNKTLRKRNRSDGQTAGNEKNKIGVWNSQHTRVAKLVRCYLIYLLKHLKFMDIKNATNNS